MKTTMPSKVYRGTLVPFLMVTIFALVAFDTEVTGSGIPFVVLHSFSASPTDAEVPLSGLVLDDRGNLYGTDPDAVFTINEDGSGFRRLHSFTDVPLSDGFDCEAGLVLDGHGVLYGTTLGGGANNYGVIFKIQTDGTGYGVLHSFSTSPADTGSTIAGLILDNDGNLYGTSPVGGFNREYGAVFTLKTDGTAFRILHSFSDSPADGSEPVGGLVLDQYGNLYGTTVGGGSNNAGTIFRMDIDGTDFSLLHSFSNSPSDGVGAEAALILDKGGNLFGTTSGAELRQIVPADAAQSLG